MSAGIGVGRESSFAVRTDGLKMNVGTISRTAWSRCLISPLVVMHWHLKLLVFTVYRAAAAPQVRNPVLISRTVCLSPFSFWSQISLPRDDWWVVPLGSSLRSSDQIPGASPSVVASLSGAFRLSFCSGAPQLLACDDGRWEKVNKGKLVLGGLLGPQWRLPSLRGGFVAIRRTN